MAGGCLNSLHVSGQGRAKDAGEKTEKGGLNMEYICDRCGRVFVADRNFRKHGGKILCRKCVEYFILGRLPQAVKKPTKESARND